MSETVSLELNESNNTPKRPVRKKNMPTKFDNYIFLMASTVEESEPMTWQETFKYTST